MQRFNNIPIVNRESTVEYVIKTIKRLLLSKQLQPGDLLPSEGALAEQLNVSRGSIREAMKILSAFGVVEIKRGDGTYIASSAGTTFMEPFLFNLILSGPDTRELVELREIIELQLVGLVVKNAQPSDLDAIEEAHSAMKYAFYHKEISQQNLVEHDLRFHTALGSASRNILVEKLYSFILELFVPYIEKTYDDERNGENALRLHEQIISALHRRDAEAAIHATRQSIEEWRRLSNEDH